MPRQRTRGLLAVLIAFTIAAAAMVALADGRRTSGSQPSVTVATCGAGCRPAPRVPAPATSAPPAAPEVTQPPPSAPSTAADPAAQGPGPAAPVAEPQPQPPATEPPVASSGNPFAARAVWPSPSFAAEASAQASAWEASRPGDAALMQRLSTVPAATWLGGWTGDVRAAVAQIVEAAASVGMEPVIVLYDIPQRDCAGWSAGGSASADAYRAWIRAVAAGLGQRPASVIVEPDALAGLDCLDASSQASRLALLDDAVTVLSGDRAASVYLDAGNASWHDAATMVSRLRQAGGTRARGFSLNVSNFDNADAELAYGDQIVAGLPGAHFVIDTSRSGAGSNGEWCNPPGRALGPAPTAATGRATADAYLWIKAPGESDGECGGGPRAGEWWPDYALALAKRSWN